MAGQKDKLLIIKEVSSRCLAEEQFSAEKKTFISRSVSVQNRSGKACI